MRLTLTLSAITLAAALPVFASSQANAFFWDDDAYSRPAYSYYGPARYDGERRTYRRDYRGLRYYRSNERAEHYRTGSRRWWNSMDQDDRGGRRR
jgi:hypothetical protein